MRCEVLWWLLWGCFHSPSVPFGPPHPVLYQVRGWDSFPGGMSLHVDPQPVLGTASPQKSSLHKEVCGGLACTEGMRCTIQPTLMPDHTHLPGLAAVACAPRRKGHPGEELLLASAGLGGARPDPGAAVARSSVTAPEQGTLGLCKLVPAPYRTTFLGHLSNSRLSFLSPCS